MSSFTSLRAASSSTSITGSRSLCQHLAQHQQLPAASIARPFSTSSPLQTKTIQPWLLPKQLIPPYPYGERRIYKQSNKGLYGSARIRFGNNVSEAHKVKTQRFWRPNVHVKVYYSEALGAKVKTRLTMRVLKTIKKEGGLENYILKNKPARVKELGPGGWRLRWLLMQTRAVQERFNEERRSLGLEPVDVENQDDIVGLGLDYATPGKLSVKSRETLFDLMIEESFTLGDEALEAESAELLTDEMEAEFLRLEEENEIKVKTEKEGVPS